LNVSFVVYYAKGNYVKLCESSVEVVDRLCYIGDALSVAGYADAAVTLGHDGEA